MIRSRFNSLLQQKLDERRAQILASVEEVPNWDTFNRVLGRLNGLADAVKLADDVDAEMSGAN